MADTDVTRIAGNIGAMNALYALNNINKQLSIHQTRLATGKRINSAADDPAGLAISTKMLSRSESLKTALSNIGDAKNLLAVAESGLGRLTDILNSMRTITENAANDTNGTDERTIVKEQLLSYAKQINDIVEQTKWSDKKLIDGSYSAAVDALTFQTGADVGETTKLSGLTNMHAFALDLVTASVAGVTQAVSTGANSALMTVGMSTSYTTQLANGSYTVETSFEADGTYTSHLMNGLTVAGTATGTYVAGTTTAQVMNFNNGVTVTLASSGIMTPGDPQTLGYVAGGSTAITAAFVDASVAPSFTAGNHTVVVTMNADGDAFDATFDGVAAATAVAYSGGGTFTVNGITVTLDDSLVANDVATRSITYTAATANSYALETSEAFDYTAFVAAQEEAVNITETTVGTVTTSLSADFSAYMSIIDRAMVSVNSQLSKIGSLTGSLTFKEDQISSSQINVEASYNRIMNANMAEEQVNASKLLILQQTSTAMLAQANAAPQFLLSLFQ